MARVQKAGLKAMFAVLGDQMETTYWYAQEKAYKLIWSATTPPPYDGQHWLALKVVRAGEQPELYQVGIDGLLLTSSNSQISFIKDQKDLIRLYMSWWLSKELWEEIRGRGSERVYIIDSDVLPHLVQPRTKKEVEEAILKVAFGAVEIEGFGCLLSVEEDKHCFPAWLDLEKIHIPVSSLLHQDYLSFTADCFIFETYEQIGKTQLYLDSLELSIGKEMASSSNRLPEHERHSGRSKSNMFAEGDHNTPGLHKKTSSSQNSETTYSIPGFILLDELGSGGFGITFKAIEEVFRDDSEPAYQTVKVIEPHPFNTLPPDTIKGRFLEEAKAIRKLRHKAIVQYTMAGVTKEQKPYIIMDFVEGATLDECSPNMSVEEKVITIKEVLEALHYAHSTRVFHRDIKPSNIMIREVDSQPILIDFGISYTLLDGERKDLTSGTMGIGSPGYVPPEVEADPKASRGPKHDIYSCGVVLYQMLVGRRPNPQKYESVIGIRPDATGLDPILQKSLAHVDERYESAGEFSRKLTLWLESHKVAPVDKSPEDKLLLLRQRLESQAQGGPPVEKDHKRIYQTLQGSVVPLIREFMNRILEFKEFFVHFSPKLFVRDWTPSPFPLTDDCKVNENDISELLRLRYDGWLQRGKQDNGDSFERCHHLILECKWEGFSLSGTNAFEMYCSMNIHFDQFVYRVSFTNNLQPEVEPYTFLYTKNLQPGQIDEMTTKYMNKLVSFVEGKTT